MVQKDFPEQDELVLCTVDRIIDTSVFVKLDSYNKEGVISTSEIAPGRIRNIRDYVRPGKRIVCKVLRVQQDTGHINLSLRRVTLKEKTKIMSDFERDKNDCAIIKTIAGEKAGPLIEKIKQDHEHVSEFIQNASAEDLKKYGFSKEEAEQITKIVNEKPEKRVFVKAKMMLTSDSGEGIVKIKNMLNKALERHKKADINYLSSPNYTITIESSDYKNANIELDKIIEEITNESKASSLKVEIIKQHN